MIRKATAQWTGTLKEGKGWITTESNTLKETPYNFTSRFESGTTTNPEELIGAAHAGCFSMAFSAKLAGAGFTPEKIETKANVTLEQVSGNWTVTTIHLDTTATVPGIDQAKFTEVANDAKANCPISRLLNAKISLEAKLQ